MDEKIELSLSWGFDAVGCRWVSQWSTNLMVQWIYTRPDLLSRASLRLIEFITLRLSLVAQLNSICHFLHCCQPELANVSIGCEKRFLVRWASIRSLCGATFRVCCSMKRLSCASSRRQSVVSNKVLEPDLTVLAEWLVQLDFRGDVQIIIFLFDMAFLVQLCWLLCWRYFAYWKWYRWHREDWVSQISICNQEHGKTCIFSWDWNCSWQIWSNFLSKRVCLRLPGDSTTWL